MLALRRTATIETLNRTIFQFRLLRGDAAHTRHRCVRLAALSELTDHFPFDSRARMDKADTNIDAFGLRH